MFWPQDLLGQLEACNKARILTYGYDSDVVGVTGTTNFTTITAQGQTLLNGLARVRENDLYRPLMFITHSLGGLIVKAVSVSLLGETEDNFSVFHFALANSDFKTLNQSLSKLTETSKDLRPVVDSTFAIIFFGTPHRGGSFADFGATRAAKVASVLSLKPHNDRITGVLGQNSEVLTKLRKDFEFTLEHMIKRNGFQSSTFQEDKGLSGFVGLQGKVFASPPPPFLGAVYSDAGANFLVARLWRTTPPN